MRIPAFLSCLLGALSTLAAEGADSPFERAPYLQLATDSSIHIVWRTDHPIRPRVRFGLTADKLDREADPGAITLRRPEASSKGRAAAPPLFKDTPNKTHQYEALVTGLEPRTTYYYAVYDGETRLTREDPTFFFRTNPKPGDTQPVHFWVVGDSGTGGRQQAKVYAAMVDYVRKRRRNLDLFLHVGDMAYGRGTTSQFSRNFFAMYETTLRHVVCWPAMGNHEGMTSKGETGVGPYYDAYVCPTRGEAGGLASGMEAYYSFDYGNVHFVVLDSHDLDRQPSGAMARWLRADLEKTKADWLVAYFHHPPYTKGTHDSDRETQLVEMRELIMPILEGGGVDIVFTGHSHIYERSMLIDGAYATPTTAKGVILDDGDGDPKGDGPYQKSAGLHPHNGTVQVVTGHGGAGIGRRGTMPIMRRIILEHGSTLVDIDGDTLTGTMLNLDGSIRDTFAIKKHGRVKHSPIADPWQPEAQGKTSQPARSIPKDATPLIPREADWAYLAGSDPPDGWARPDFDPRKWKRGAAGFGYGDGDDRTELPDMRKRYQAAYIRTDFTLPAGSNPAKLVLGISYDDGFIAYLNGTEVARSGVKDGRGRSARGIVNHEAKGFEFFPLKGAPKSVRPGRNVLAIEGHNVDLNSSDFTLHPTLYLTK